MALNQRNSNRVIISLAAFLLLTCISPLPETPTRHTDAFKTLLSSLDGTVRLVIRKSRYTMILYKGETPVKTYQAVFGRGYGDGDKQRMGDRRTPEGDFYICTMNHSKRFYKFMGLSYPGLKHAEEGLRSGMIVPDEYAMIKKAIEERSPPPWETRLGGAVGIHGRMLGAEDARRLSSDINWTDGCIALDNADVDEVYRVVSLGTPVTILP
jgi:murein L,D-transpeptidase YafK